MARLSEADRMWLIGLKKRLAEAELKIVGMKLNAAGSGVSLSRALSEAAAHIQQILESRME